MDNTRLVREMEKVNKNCDISVYIAFFLYLCGVKFEMEHEDIKLQQFVGEIPSSKLHQAGGEFPAPMKANK